MRRTSTLGSDRGTAGFDRTYARSPCRTWAGTRHPFLARHPRAWFHTSMENTADNVSPAERLRRVFASGRFVLTAELECPRNASAANVERQARGYAPWVDAVNCTDNS